MCASSGPARTGRVALSIGKMIFSSRPTRILCCSALDSSGDEHILCIHEFPVSMYTYYIFSRLLLFVLCVLAPFTAFLGCIAGFICMVRAVILMSCVLLLYIFNYYRRFIILNAARTCRQSTLYAVHPHLNTLSRARCDGVDRVPLACISACSTRVCATQ